MKNTRFISRPVTRMQANGYIRINECIYKILNNNVIKESYIGINCIMTLENIASQEVVNYEFGYKQFGYAKQLK
jgi:hypothetical protein